MRQGDDEPERLAGHLPAHRDTDRQVPPVYLADLTGEIGGPLVGPRRQELRPHLGEVVFEDGDAAGVSPGLQSLPNHGGRCPRVFREEGEDLLPEGV